MHNSAAPPSAMSDPSTAAPRIRDLGHRTFAGVHAEMLAMLETVRKGDSPGEVWLVEHDPVFTAGRATPKNELQERTAPTQGGSVPIAVVPIERGGQVTYHGPGQLVIYPIVPLPSKDVRAWLQSIEAFGVAICERFGAVAEASADGTGVFVEDHAGATRKVASIGVAIRHWINIHGIAINIDMDLAPFHSIRPCGKDPELMTDIATALKQPVTMHDACAAAQACLPILLGSGYSSAQ